jgi:carboxymethylenebutenolidase
MVEFTGMVGGDFRTMPMIPRFFPGKEFQMADSHPEGYLARPPADEGPDVLVLHAWWGLNDTIKALCDRLAEAGFVAFAPDLYHGQVAGTIPEAEALGKALDANYQQAIDEIEESVAFLSERASRSENGLAVIAFSLGAYYALELSNADPEHIRAVVLFYGSGGENFGNSQAAYQGHFAENDEYEPPASVDQLEDILKQAGRPVSFYRYPNTGHWFFESDRPEAYDPQAASLAWERTLAFLKSFSGL